jgi:DNA-binding CsgD family transcriptional regulator
MKTLRDRTVLIQTASSQNEAFLRFNEAMGEYGYNNNVYTMMTDHASIGEAAFHGIATTYPEAWLKFYKEQNYKHIDAVWTRLMKSPLPFFWSDLMADMKRDVGIPEKQLAASVRLMHEAEDAGVADGVGISYVNSLGEIVGIGLSRSHSEKDHRYEDLAEVYLLSTIFHEKFMSFYRAPTTPILSIREREVLLWAADNLSDTAIADRMNVTVPTVRFHWKNIFAKLEVKGRLPAVIKAMRLQIVSPGAPAPTYRVR